MAFASGRAEEHPYPTWQDVAKNGEGQQLCTGTQVAGFDRCRYSFEARAVDPVVAAETNGTAAAAAARVPSRCGYCTGNTPATEQADIVCDLSHSVLIESPNTTQGRDAAACCVTTGMCTNNTRWEEEPDVICPMPQVLRPPGADHGGWRPGRSVDACCWTQRMCVGDTDGEPDISCQAPSVLRSDATLIEARDEQSCCVTYCSAVSCEFPAMLRPDAGDIEVYLAGLDTTSICCVTTGMCAGNSDSLREPDVTCSAPSLPRPGFATHRVGRTEAQCCEISGMCAGNSDAAVEPPVYCEVDLGQRPIRTVRTPWSDTWREFVSDEGSFARGRSRAECCECSAADAAVELGVVEPSPVAEGYCFAAGAEDTTLAVSEENECTRVMHYAGCLELLDCRIDGPMGDQARLTEPCTSCAEVRTLPLLLSRFYSLGLPATFAQPTVRSHSHAR